MQTATALNLNRRDATALLVLGTILALQWILGGGMALFTRPLWLDEVHTHTLVTDLDLVHSLAALADGVDYNPPGLYLLQRLWGTLWGEVTTTTLRTLSALSIGLTLTGLYLVLRTVTTPLVATTAVLAVSAHPLMISHAAEARFYGPWCACTIWMMWCLLRATGDPRCWICGVSACVLAALACMIQYLAILSVVAVILPLAWTHRRDKRRLAWLVLTAASALASTLLVLPLARSQRAALTIPTWVEPVSFWNIMHFLSDVLPLFPLMLCGLAAWSGRMILPCCIPTGSASACQHRFRPAQSWDQTLILFCALLLFPLVLIAFSIVVQPVLIGRYAIVTLLGAGGIAAWSLSHATRRGVLLTGVAFVVLGMIQVANLGSEADREGQERRHLLAALHQLPTESLIVFEGRHEMYPLLLLDPSLSQRARLLDFDDDQLRHTSAMRTVERDVARRFSQHYATFKLIPFSELPSLGEFYLVPLGDKTDPGTDFAGYATLAVSDRVFRLTGPVTPVAMGTGLH